MIMLVAISVFLAVAGIVWVVYSSLVGSQGRMISGRLKTFTDGSEAVLHGDGLPGKRIKKDKRDDIFQEIDSRIFQKRNFFQSQLLEFQKADLSLRYSEYLGLYCVTIFGGMILGYVVTQDPLFVMLLGTVGVFIPRTYVKIRQTRRIKNIDNQLVDALILVSNSLKSGYSFLQGIELVAEEAPKPISDEFSRVMKETNLGMNLDDALDGLTERVPSEDLDLVITAVKIQRQIGGNLSEVLDRIIHTIRQRIRIKGEINTLTAQGKLQGIILTLLPPGIAIGIYGMSPEFMEPLFTTTLGKAMIGVAFFLQLIGGIMIKKIVEIKV